MYGRGATAYAVRRFESFGHASGAIASDLGWPRIGYTVRRRAYNGVDTSASEP